MLPDLHGRGFRQEQRQRQLSTKLPRSSTAGARVEVPMLIKAVAAPPRADATTIHPSQRGKTPLWMVRAPARRKASTASCCVTSATAWRRCSGGVDSPNCSSRYVPRESERSVCLERSLKFYEAIMWRLAETPAHSCAMHFGTAQGGDQRGVTAPDRRDDARHAQSARVRKFLNAFVREPAPGLGVRTPLRVGSWPAVSAS
jgi:hypothetical protein